MNQIHPIRSWARSLKLWLGTNLLGTAAAMLVFMFRASADGPATGLLVGMFGAFCSLPILLLAVPLFDWVRGLATQRERVAMAAGAITILWLVAVVIFYSLLDFDGYAIIELFVFLFPYYIAALLVGGFVYRSWLFQSHE